MYIVVLFGKVSEFVLCGYVSILIKGLEGNTIEMILLVVSCNYVYCIQVNRKNDKYFLKMKTLLTVI